MKETNERNRGRNTSKKRQKTGQPKGCPAAFICNINYSARNVKRWKPVAVSSLSKPFKKSATEIFSFWQ